jgi:DNA invertase Pin-like site-specific DNA recombinase
MGEEKRIKVIKAYKQYKLPRVAIYCRISTRNQEQVQSLANQVSYLTQYVFRQPGWTLVDTYLDIRSGKDMTTRSEFQRMLDDCAAHKIDQIITKSISRFGRNTVEILSAINRLKELGVDIYFENDGVHTLNSENVWLITLLEGIAQEESRSRSENIKWGIVHKIESGKGKIFQKKCFGYDPDLDGELIINETEAQTVRLIFDLYLQGYSVLAIIRELKHQNIKSPTGNDQWSKRTIDTILANEKYSGDVIVLKSYTEEYPDSKRRPNKGEKALYQALDAVPAIITKEQFKAVAAEKERRSNIVLSDGRLVRKATHYSMKKTNLELLNESELEKESI